MASRKSDTTSAEKQPKAEKSRSGSRAPKRPAAAGKPRRPSLPKDVIAVLLEVAGNMRENAYVPYSNYRVGAALLAASGNVYGGCNVENSSFGLTICAERGAVAKAISEGDGDFVAIAVVTDDGGTPCGACRQVLAEFGDDIVVIVANAAGDYTLSTSGQLLPLAFRLR